MDVGWTVVLPTFGRAVAVPTCSDDEAFRRQLGRFLDQEAGYLEVSKVGSAYPMLALSTSGSLAVVHRFDDAETCLLLKGGGRVRPEDSGEFLIQDEWATFTGEFISPAERASSVLRAFVQAQDIDELGEWVRL